MIINGPNLEIISLRLCGPYVMYGGYYVDLQREQKNGETLSIGVVATAF